MVDKERSAAEIEKDMDRLDWENEDPKMVLSRLYDLTVERMQSEQNWYEKLIPRMRWGSYALRAFSLAFLIFGVIAPLLGVMKFPAGDAALQLRYSYAGYIGLALAGILFSIDKFFVVSKTWMRYISAKLIIAKKMLEFRYKWQDLRAEMKGTDDIDPAKQKLIIADFQKFVCDIMDEVIKETGSWRSDLEEGLKAQSDKLSQADQKLRNKLSQERASEKK
ncbi:MAG: SLATT domain-containing protein [Desulfobacterales bacterium]|nr:MAG: SLATT domain-containing protein [Desulfobacterales bacterium]